MAFDTDFAALKVKDIMTRNVIAVTRRTPIRCAIELIAKHNITGLPVVKDDMTLEGIISEKDVLRLLHGHKDDEDKTVNDFMTEPVVYCEESESLLYACDCLMNYSFRRIPVTSKGKLVGIITRRDLIYEYVLQRKLEVLEPSNK